MNQFSDIGCCQIFETDENDVGGYCQHDCTQNLALPTLSSRRKLEIIRNCRQDGDQEMYQVSYNSKKIIFSVFPPLSKLVTRLESNRNVRNSKRMQSRGHIPRKEDLPRLHASFKNT